MTAADAHERGRNLDGLSAALFRPVANDWLIVYRVGFGAVMLGYYALALGANIPVTNYAEVPIHFGYPGLRWVREVEWSWTWGSRTYWFIQLEFWLLALCSLSILLGACYRWAATLFALPCVHVFLIDKAYYQNHYYLISLLACQLPFLPADRAGAIDCRLRPSIARNSTPTWTLWLTRFTVGIPYFFGGIAKFDSDWLRGQPMRLALAQRADVALLGGDWMRQEWCVQAVIWGGLLFDLLIVPALLYRRTRATAYLLAVGFHLTNACLWEIGIFPWLMIVATTVFLQPDWPRRLATLGTGRRLPTVALDPLPAPSRGARAATVSVLGVFVLWQLLFPWRWMLSPGHPHWDEYQHVFSWHMLLRAKECGLRIYVTSLQEGRTGVIDPLRYITGRQLHAVSRDPRMIQQLCREVAADLRERGYGAVEIRALALVSLNGRRPQLMIDPAVDLAAVELCDEYPEFVLPLREPFRPEGWNIPRDAWESQLQLQLPPEMQQAARPSASGPDPTG